MLKQKKKLCNNCNTETFIWKHDKNNRYCKGCWFKLKETKKPLTIKKPINKNSKKMQITNAAYTILRKKFMEEKPICEASLHCCIGKSTDVHHKMLRGKYHLVVATWLSVCRPCHNYIHNYPEKAKELGLLNDFNN
jgi:hypothetical protein